MRPHPEQPNKALARFSFILFSIVSIIAFGIIASAQSPRLPVAHMMQLDDIRKRPCDLPVAEGFRCAWIFDTGLPSSRLIASVVGGTVDQISVYLDGALYTVAYDPPLKRDDRFANLRRGVQIAARIEGHDLILQWSEHTRVRGKIIQREKMFPNDPQPA